MIIINGKEVKKITFPNGEIGIDIKELNINNINEIKFKYESDLDLIVLMFVKKQIDNTLLSTDKFNKLFVTYMPYSRMDREDGFIFTLKYVAEFINNLRFDLVVVFEPHSDVTTALLDNCMKIDLSLQISKKAIEKINFDKNIDYICFPDGTADKRYSKYFDGYKTLIGSKNRDFKTGFIKDLKIIGDIDSKDFKVLIVDDLCSKGGTFLLTASKLKQLGAKEIYLAVAHCENSVFDGDMIKSNLINKIYTSDSILSSDSMLSRCYVQMFDIYYIK